MVGNGLTVTATVAVLLQPVTPLVPVTVYVVFEAGFAVTVAPVVADKPVEGDHV
jgi:hypothetical protein